MFKKMLILYKQQQIPAAKLILMHLFKYIIEFIITIFEESLQCRLFVTFKLKSRYDMFIAAS